MAVDSSFYPIGYYIFLFSLWLNAHSYKTVAHHVEIDSFPHSLFYIPSIL